MKDTIKPFVTCPESSVLNFTPNIYHERDRLKSELIQAGHTFLLKFNCPTCLEQCLLSYPLSHSECCKTDLSKLEIKVINRRLLSGSRRKQNKITKRITAQLIAAQGDWCAYCNESMKDNGMHVEHILAISVGGTNSIENLCLSCAKCNQIAGAKFFSSFLAKKIFILKNRRLL